MKEGTKSPRTGPARLAPPHTLSFPFTPATQAFCAFLENTGGSPLGASHLGLSLPKNPPGAHPTAGRKEAGGPWWGAAPALPAAASTPHRSVHSPGWTIFPAGHSPETAIWTPIAHCLSPARGRRGTDHGETSASPGSGTAPARSGRVSHTHRLVAGPTSGDPSSWKEVAVLFST